MLVVTARNPLQERYGSAGYDQIRAALDAWAAVDGALVLAIDDPVEMEPRRLTASPATFSGIQMTIWETARQYKAETQSVLLAGGAAILPFYPVGNPVQDRTLDQDVTVASDNPYGMMANTLAEQLAPSRPVGRMAVADDARIDQFVKLVEDFPHRKNPPPAGQAGAALIINSDWADYSRRVAQGLPEPLIWHLTPGYEMTSANQSDAARANLYFNLHGFSGEAEWKSYSTLQKDFSPAVTPAALDRSSVAGAISFAECCYGAQIEGRSPDNSCALKLVQEGASFVGATGLAYGSYLASDVFLEDADFLARAFFQAVGQGASLGVALSTARKLYLNNGDEAPSGEAWQYKQKTLLQFVLLGNPETVQ